MVRSRPAGMGQVLEELNDFLKETDQNPVSIEARNSLQDRSYNLTCFYLCR